MKVLGCVSKKLLLLFQFIIKILFIDQQFKTIDPTFTQQDNFVAQPGKMEVKLLRHY